MTAVTQLGWVDRTLRLLRQLQTNVEAGRNQIMRDGGGQLPDDYDARAATLLDGVCRSIRKAVTETQALEHMAELREKNRMRGQGE